MKYVVWDWNGTIFNDVELCITCMNKLLEKNKLPLIKDEDQYRSKFSFPVKDYYEKVGFDFEKIPFSELATEFIELYQKSSLQCSLTTDIENSFIKFRELGYKQIILSASKTKNLIQQLNQFEIGSYFEEILGISDIYAKSKIEIADEWIKDKKIESLILIGDSYHDLEVAKTLNATCFLYSKGHQLINNSVDNKYVVVDDINQVFDYL